MLEPLDWSMDDQDESQGQGNEFGEYYRSLDSALHLNMETPDSFLDAVPLRTVEEKEHMNELVYLGQLQRDAPCNNRYDKLEMLRRERGRFQEMIAAYAEEEELDKFVLTPVSLDGQEIMDKIGILLQGILPEYLGGDGDLKAASQRVEDLAVEIKGVEVSIRTDVSYNVFEDYGTLKRLYMFNDRDRRYNGLKYLWETWFTKKAIGRASVLMQDTRRRNSQAHHAKLMEDFNYDMAKVTRSLQGRGGRNNGRRNSGGGESEGEMM